MQTLAVYEEGQGYEYVKKLSLIYKKIIITLTVYASEGKSKEHNCAC